jgi:hypothetical protein
MSTPHEFERIPAAWTAAQVAAVREATAELRAARLRAQRPPVRRIQRFAHPLAGYGALLGCILLFGPILTCAGFALPVLTCAGLASTHPGVKSAMVSPQHPALSGVGVARDEEGTPEAWYSYRGRDGVTVYGFGVPPLGSTIVSLDPGDHRFSAAGPGAGSGTYAGTIPPSSSVIAAPGGGHGGGHRYR